MLKSFSPKITGNVISSKRLYFHLIVGFAFLDIFLFRGSFRLFAGPLGYGPFICFYVLLPFFVAKYKFPTYVVAMLCFVTLFGSTGFLSGNVSTNDFIKSTGSLILPYVYYWYLWQFFGKDVIRGFRAYLNGAVIVSIFGLMLWFDSQLSFGLYEVTSSIIRLGFNEGTYGMRIASTLGEPTYFANVLAPGSFFAITRLFFPSTAASVALKQNGLWLNKRSAFIILLAQVLSFSAIAYMGFLISVGLNLKIKRNIFTILLAPFLLLTLFSLVRLIPEFETRLSGLMNLDRIADDDIHGSSAILYNHAIITWENFKRNPIVGTGLASHSLAAEKYSILERNTNLASYSSWNGSDASSMFLRIASELGLVGIMITIVFLFVNRVRAEPGHPHILVYQFVNSAILVTILLQLFRQGNFILNGFPFFIYGYYFSKRNADMVLSYENRKLREHEVPFARLFRSERY